MPKFKVLLQTTFLACALCSWNAVAIDRPDISAMQVSNKFSANSSEGMLIKSLLEITQGNLQQAMGTVDQLLQKVPNFKLAYLVRGDLLMAQAQQLQGFGNSLPNPPEVVENFREEARARIEHYLAQQAPQTLPEPLWQLDATQRYVIVVDVDKSRLYVYRNEDGRPSYIADYYVTLGKNGGEKQQEGDKRTPLGVYFTGIKLSKKLPDIYGDAAYPLNYPNEWDEHQGKKGHGIWLHGTPSDTYSRPPRASDGCVVMTNQDLKSLAPILENNKTLVVIADNMQWLKTNEDALQKQSLADALEAWRRDWQSQDTDKYLTHYSERFFSQDSDLINWSKEKRRIQASKPIVSVKLSNVSMLRYPNNALKMAVINFDQDFKSPVLDSHMRKRQYWIQEGQQWKIIYEGPA